MENIKRVYTLRVSTSPDEYVLNDAKSDSAWAYGDNAQALTDTATAIGTDTRAGTKGYSIAIQDNKLYMVNDTVKNQTDIYLETIADSNAFLKNDKVGIFTTDENFYWFNAGKVLDVKEENNQTKVTVDISLEQPEEADKIISGSGILFVTERAIEDNNETIYVTDFEPIGQTNIGFNSSAEGLKTRALADESHTEGYETVGLGWGAHAEGIKTQAGYAGHSEGYETQAQAPYSHAEGIGTIAAAPAQHVQGLYNEIHQESENIIHIVGAGTPEARKTVHTIDKEGNALFTGAVKAANFEVLSATGESDPLVTESQVEEQIKIEVANANKTNYYSKDEINAMIPGRFTRDSQGNPLGARFGDTEVKAEAEYSMASGIGVKTMAPGSLAVGTYNSPSADYLFSVGNGASSSALSNAFSVKTNGNAHFAGKITYGSNIEVDMSKIPTIYLKTQAPTAQDVEGKPGDLWIVLESETS